MHETTLAGEIERMQRREIERLRNRESELLAACNAELERRRAAERALEEATMPMETFLHRKNRWSLDTFGPGTRTEGLLAHIRKELVEIEKDPHDLAEWIDVMMLAVDGYWRHGGKAECLVPDMKAKHAINLGRKWIRQPEGHHEHDRSGE